MRARPREINIFNMSLLDILCGALGAFCFMMLVALPYYVGGGAHKERVEREREIDQAIAKIEQYRTTRNLSGTQSEDLRKLLEELEAKIKQLEGQLNQYAYENDQLKKKIDDLTNANSLLASENTRLTSDNQQLVAENELLKKNQGAAKQFVVAAVASEVGQEVSLFPEDVTIQGATDKAKFANPEFDPNLPTFKQWEHDDALWVPLKGVSLLIRTVLPRSSYRMFVRYLTRAEDHSGLLLARPLMRTTVNLLWDGDFTAPPKGVRMMLTPERPWALVGTLTIDEQAKLTFTEATEAERNDAWEKITKAHPTPTPAPAATVKPITREEMEDLRKRRDQIRRETEEKQKQRGPLPFETSPAPSAAATP